MADYAAENVWTDEFLSIVNSAAEAEVIGASDIADAIADEDYGAFDEAYGSYADSLIEEGYDVSEIYDAALGDDVEGIPILQITVSGSLEYRSLLKTDSTL